MINKSDFSKPKIKDTMIGQKPKGHRYLPEQISRAGHHMISDKYTFSMNRKTNKFGTPL
jgi:hypothetical protein